MKWCNKIQNFQHIIKIFFKFYVVIKENVKYFLFIEYLSRSVDVQVMVIFFFVYWFIVIINFWCINQYDLVVTLQIFFALVFEQFNSLCYSSFLISLGGFSSALFLLNLLLMVDAILLCQFCFTITCDTFKMWDKLLWRYLSLFCRCENCRDTDMTLVSLGKNWIWMRMASKCFSDMGQYTYDVHENCLNFQEPPTPCPSTSKIFPLSWPWNFNFKQLPSPEPLQKTM